MLRQITHIGLALLLLISSAGVAVNKHFCQNELKSVALFVKAKSCHNGKVKKPCPIHGYMLVDASPSDKGCCDDETEIVKSEEEQIAPSSPDETTPPPGLLIQSPLALLLHLPRFDRRSLHYLNYKPPLLTCDYPSQLQVFLC